ncbi:uncharacterized protein L969DRAFT_92726 [Mixia osmundae IAM 14324]|uniref:[histone H3]-trimethyl-L-lysine(9) demethylase n=1 Tax=Mixia osmundae (strain CBS 9802 / IAM 14324 / JCM 22182 / KY 12970) TaxID=764103 RepID=G7DYD5_MIXOS|nr:uncharacterized protein L969DRAFT_92726 [Mixia osmundae IAM 14324]KEI41497.1 hypothetical protein L969DRAFT_92726 [Mixia osmundae IAM 14324]GAA95595.1 hypothetical protein E5Q_02251 [Mixia osmundae IAM 14324]
MDADGPVESAVPAEKSLTREMSPGPASPAVKSEAAKSMSDRSEAGSRHSSPPTSLASSEDATSSKKPSAGPHSAPGTSKKPRPRRRIPVTSEPRPTPELLASLTEREDEYTGVDSDDSDDDSSEIDIDELEDLDLPPGLGTQEGRKTYRRIRPAYYYRPDLSTSLCKGTPVFMPTMEEFMDFYAFIKSVDRYGMQAGIVKVVPPKEWTESLTPIDHPLRQTKIKSPICQHILGQKGLFNLHNVARTRSYNVKQWKAICDDPTRVSPDFWKRSARHGGDDSESPPKTRSRAFAAGTNRPQKKRKGAPDSDDENEPASKQANALPKDEPEVDVEEHKGESLRPGELFTDKEWEDFDLPSQLQGPSPSDYTADVLKEIERRYWRSLAIGSPPMYGADSAGSLFDPKQTVWNVAELDNLLSRVGGSRKIPGVNTPYLYFGSWRATFAWHVEDMDLYSINYLHFGAPKCWYSVPQREHERFEQYMAGQFASARNTCPQFMRHKSYLASPTIISNHGITLNRCVQFAGEFMLTYPHGYHSGFNLGFNCAESVNFATEEWVPIGRKAKKCGCVDDSVTINVDQWLMEAAQSKLQEDEAKGIVRKPIRAYKPVKKPKIDDSVKVKLTIPAKPPYVCALCPDLSTEGLVPLAGPLSAAAFASSAGISAVSAPAPTSVDMPMAGSEDQAELPLTDDVVAMAEANKITPTKKTIKTLSGIRHAHRICATFIPMTWIDRDGETGQELVYGVDKVERARWNLKCQLCSDRHGAKVQCTRSKSCYKACHATCAMKADSTFMIDAVIRLEHGLVSCIEAAKPLQEGETEDNELSEKLAVRPAIYSAADLLKPIGEVQTVVLCTSHNPLVLAAATKKKHDELAARIAAIPTGSPLLVRTSGGICDVTLARNVPEHGAVIVCFSTGTHAEYKYAKICDEEARAKEAAKLAARAKADQEIYVYNHSQRSAAASPSMPTGPYQISTGYAGRSKYGYSASAYAANRSALPSLSDLGVYAPSSCPVSTSPSLTMQVPAASHYSSVYGANLPKSQPTSLLPVIQPVAPPASRAVTLPISLPARLPAMPRSESAGTSSIYGSSLPQTEAFSKSYGSTYSTAYTQPSAARYTDLSNNRQLPPISSLLPGPPASVSSPQSYTLYPAYTSSLPRSAPPSASLPAHAIAHHSQFAHHTQSSPRMNLQDSTPVTNTL